MRSPGAALRPGAYELKKPGIIRANYTCAHSCRRGGPYGATPPPRPGLPRSCPAWREGVHRGAARKRQGGGPRGGEPPASGVGGESPLPPKRGPHHTADALQPGTPRNGSVAELEDRTRIGVRVPGLRPKVSGPKREVRPLWALRLGRMFQTPEHLVSAEDRTYPVGRGQCCQVPEAPGPGRDSPVLVSETIPYAQMVTRP